MSAGLQAAHLAEHETLTSAGYRRLTGACGIITPLDQMHPPRPGHR